MWYKIRKIALKIIQFALTLYAAVCGVAGHIELWSTLKENHPGSIYDYSLISWIVGILVFCACYYGGFSFMEECVIKPLDKKTENKKAEENLKKYLKDFRWDMSQSAASAVEEQYKNDIGSIDVNGMGVSCASFCCGNYRDKGLCCIAYDLDCTAETPSVVLGKAKSILEADFGKPMKTEENGSNKRFQWSFEEHNITLKQWNGIVTLWIYKSSFNLFKI